MDKMLLPHEEPTSLLCASKILFQFCHNLNDHVDTHRLNQPFASRFGQICVYIIIIIIIIIMIIMIIIIIIKIIIIIITIIIIVIVIIIIVIIIIIIYVATHS